MSGFRMQGHFGLQADILRKASIEMSKSLAKQRTIQGIANHSQSESSEEDEDDKEGSDDMFGHLATDEDIKAPVPVPAPEKLRASILDTTDSKPRGARRLLHMDSDDV